MPGPVIAGTAVPIRGGALGSGAGLTWVDPVINRTTSTPPGSPSPGDRYIVAATATGAWAGKENSIADWNGATWEFRDPEAGLTTYVTAETEYFTWNGAAWVQESFGPHAATHEKGGTDEVTLENLLTASVDGQVAVSKADGSLAMKKFFIVEPTDDFAATINAIGSNSFIWLADGQHDQTAQIDISGKTNIEIAGSRAAKVNITYSDGNNPPWKITAPCSDLMFRGFTIDYNGTAGGPATLFQPLGTGGALNARLAWKDLNVRIDNGGSGGTIMLVRNNGADADLNGLTIESCILTGADVRGLLRFDLAAGRTIKRVQILGNRVERDAEGGVASVSAFGTGALLEDVVVQGNTFTNLGEPVYISCGATVVRKIVIEGNTFNGGGGSDGVRIEGSGLTAAVLEDNIFDDCGSGSSLQILQGTFIKCESNTVLNSKGVGLVIGSNVSKSTFDNNTITGSASHGISAAGSDNDIRDNTCRDNTGWGLIEASATDGCNYFGNTLEDNTAGNESMHASSTNRTRLHRVNDVIKHERLELAIDHGVNGVINPDTDTIASFTNSGPDRTYSIQPTGSTFAYYSNGERFESSGKTHQISADEGFHYVYMDEDGEIGSDTTWTDLFITKYCFLAAIYWDATNSKQIYFGREHLHTMQMGGRTHLWGHNSKGFALESGGALTSIIADGDGSLDSHAQFGNEASVAWDEDAEFAMALRASTADMPKYYRSGADASKIWRISEADSFGTVKTGGVGEDRPAWNELNAGTWGLTELSADNRLLLLHVALMNDGDRHFVGFIGQVEYQNIAAARAGAIDEINSLILEGLPAPEIKFVASIIYQGSDSYTNTPNARIRTTDTGDDYIDLREQSIGRGGAAGDLYEPLVDQQQVFYVGKHGSDTNDGKSIGRAFLTIDAARSAAAALSPSSEATAIAVKVIDDAEYDEDITHSQWVNVEAPLATLKGKQTIARESRLLARRLINDGNNEVVVRTAAAGECYVEAQEIVGGGTGVNTVELGGGGNTHIQATRIQATGNGNAINQTAGNLHMYCQWVTASSGVAFNMVAGGNAYGFVAYMSGGTGIKLATATSIARLTVLRLAGGYDVGASTTLYLLTAQLTGTETNNGTVYVTKVGDEKPLQSIIIAVSDETTPLTTGTAKVTFRMPYAFSVTDVRASVGTAPTGSVLTVDINEGGVSILSTKLTIDDGEKTSTTAATPAVISDGALADDSEITVDIDGIGSTVAGAGLKVSLIGYRA